jgi:putative hydrolase of HD superfamily
MTTALTPFFYEIGNARQQPRSWQAKIGVPMANVAEHTYRVNVLAMYLAVKEGGDPLRACAISQFHDAEEIRTGDHDPFQRTYLQADGNRAMADLFAGNPLEQLALSLFKEYKERTSLEAKCVKDADILDTVFELHELAARGTNYLAAIGRDKLDYKRSCYFTQAARQLHDAIISAGPHTAWSYFLEHSPSTFKTGSYGK